MAKCNRPSLAAISLPHVGEAPSVHTCPYLYTRVLGFKLLSTGNCFKSRHVS